MAIEHQVLSTLASTEEVISPPPMLDMVLSSVFRESGEVLHKAAAKPFDANITTRLLRESNLSSISEPNSKGKRGSDYSNAKSLILSLSIYNQLVSRGFARDRHFLIEWQRYLEVANASQYIATLFEPTLVEKAYIAGLLHDFGRICLRRYFPEEASLAQSMTLDGKDVITAERGVFGTDHQEIGHLVAVKWGMPQQLTEVICNHHSIQESITSLPPLTRIIILADNLLFIRQLSLETIKGDRRRLNLVKECAESLGIEVDRLDCVYSILPNHFLQACQGKDQIPALKSLSKMNDELFGLYIELSLIFKERHELSKRMLEESREEGTLESLKMTMSTLSHYINNAIMSISGKGEMLQMLYDIDDKEGIFERIPDMTRTIAKTVRKISVILEELSSIINLNKTKYFKDSKAIDIDTALKARLETD